MRPPSPSTPIGRTSGPYRSADRVRSVAGGGLSESRFLGFQRERRRRFPQVSGTRAVTPRTVMSDAPLVDAKGTSASPCPSLAAARSPATRDPDRSGFGVQTLVKRCTNRLHAAAWKCAGLEDDDRSPASKHAGRAQPREAGADDNDG